MSATLGVENCGEMVDVGEKLASLGLVLLEFREVPRSRIVTWTYCST